MTTPPKTAEEIAKCPICHKNFEECEHTFHDLGVSMTHQVEDRGACNFFKYLQSEGITLSDPQFQQLDVEIKFAARRIAAQERERLLQLVRDSGAVEGGGFSAVHWELRDAKQALWVCEAKLGEANRLLEGDAKIRARIVAERDAALAKPRAISDQP